MSAYKEYGGYLEMERGRGGLYHDNAVYLNSARNALKYVIRAYDIKRIAVPYFTCPVMWQAIEEEGCAMNFYEIDKNMKPKLDHIKKDEFILCNNYFGIQSREIQQLAGRYPNLIVDNAQAFFSHHCGIASIYSPRKFFGLPDGGIVVTVNRNQRPLEIDVSYQRCEHLMKRHDLGASAAYADFCEADKQLDSAPVKAMSNLTKNLMCSIDYNYVKKRRRQNFKLMHQSLASLNALHIDLTDVDIPMAYPLLIESDNLKAKLIGKKVYVATYWPQLETICPEGSDTLYLKNNLVPLPIDQRYGCDDISSILNIVHDLLAGVQ